MAYDGTAADGAHQNIARASITLDALANAGDKGLRLTDVSRITGLSKTASHRCLAGLVAYGLATSDPETNLFYLGDRIMFWAERAGERFRLAERVKPYLQRVADKSGDTVYFSLRRGDEAVCYGRAEGSYPIKTLTLNVGDRRPLGIGSGSLAILAFLDEAEIQRLLAVKAPDRAGLPIDDSLLVTMVEHARTAGYALMDGYLVPGMSAIGVPVRDAQGVVKASLSIAALSERIYPPRRDELLGYLKEESAIIADELADLLVSV